MMRAAIILGTRPEIIKMSPIIRECQRRSLDFFVLHTGQHYSYEMDKVFFDDLELPRPEFNLDAGSGTHAAQTGKIMAGIEKVLMEQRPEVVLVQGDTNTVLAGALAASKMGIKIGHVEAGLRSYDRTMPEEVNRVLCDHVSDYLFVPTEQARENLAKEGITKGVINTGNTIVDAVYQGRKIAESKAGVLSSLGLERGGYMLVTAHRQENVDVKEKVSSMVKGLQMVHTEFGLPLIFPVHPRTKNRLMEFKLDLRGIRTINPVGFLDFLQLEANALLALTDSGGVQEEACILGVPCVTLRENTERPETIEVGANMLSGTDPLRILNCAQKMILNGHSWQNPFGDGRAAERIVDAISP